MQMSSVERIFRDNLRLGIKDAVIEVQDEAQSNHRFTSQSGDLERAVETEFKSNGMAGRVYLDTNVAPYAGCVHQGTPAHNIFPQQRKWLRWPDGSRFIFAKAVHHPGTKADEFLYKALETKRDEVEDILDRHVDRALEEVANAFKR